MFIAALALVSETNEISSSQLTRVSAALQKQALRDFGPIWSQRPTIDAFVALDEVPLGYWPVIIRDDIDVPGAAGVHEDKDGQPFALVQYSDSWSLTASHECLEMLADPAGTRIVAGPSPKSDQGRVEFLVEVCDPSEAAEFAYTVNDIVVSDFYTPHYFDPVATTSARYSFTGAITAPREVLKGGYLSWHEPVSDHWWQETFFDASPSFRDLGVITAKGSSLRSAIDAMTPLPDLFHGLEPEHPTLTAAVERSAAASESTSSKARGWREEIERILSSK